MPSTPKFHGLWPAMLTPLDAKGRPALKEAEKLVELFVQQRLDGIYLLGSTGQGPLLSPAERQLVADCVVRAAAGRIPVMVHVGAVSTDDSVELARHASRIGAAAISSVGPIYYRVGADVVFEHFRRIGAAGELPFFVYHLSGVSSPSLGGREYVDRLLGLPNVAGMKFTDRDLYQLGLICAYGGDRMQVFSGADELLCQAVLCGACGAIGTFYNVWGLSCRAARQKVVGGDVEAGSRFMRAFQMALDEVLASQSIWAFLQGAMRIKHGIEIGQCRAPLGATDRPWKESDLERVLALVDDAV
ncbi:MAG: dihydrodipicolinate synthase family protein [Planctomycetales bacterium]